MSHERKRRFQPRLWPTAATVVGLTILLSLGTWQTIRYFEKVEVEAQRAAHLDEPPIKVKSLAEFEAQAKPFSPVEVQGHLDPEYVFLFKHRTHNGRPGYWLGGLLRFETGPGALVVNRGWLPREQAHSLAAKPPSSEPTTYTGLVYQPADVIADDDTRAELQARKSGLKNAGGAPVEWETYDLAGITEALPMATPGVPTALVLGPAHSGRPYPLASLDYVTQPYLTAERHMSYAVFWYFTAIALLAMYLANALGYLGSAPHRPAPA